MSLSEKNHRPIRSQLDSEFVLYDTAIARFLKSINAAILLRKINAWVYHCYKKGTITNDSKHGDGWIYLTIEEIERETALSRDQQDVAVRILVQHGLIEKKVMGVPAKRFFRLNTEKMEKLISDLNDSFDRDQKNITSLRETHKLDCGKPTNWIAGNPQTGHYIEPENKPEKYTTSEVASAPLSADADVLLSLFIETLKKIKPDIKIPASTTKWHQELERMLRIDKRNIEIAKAIIAWLPSNQFWSKNILSAGSLREKFDKLEMEKNKPQGSYGQQRQEQPKESFIRGGVKNQHSKQ